VSEGPSGGGVRHRRLQATRRERRLPGADSPSFDRTTRPPMDGVSRTRLNSGVAVHSLDYGRVES
jgi:hypothetical protein